MKYLILTTIVLFSMSSYAGETCSERQEINQVQEQKEINTDVPSHLKGATICVKLADNRESCVPAEKFKVVPRKQQYLVTKVSSSTSRSCVTDAKLRRNRVSAAGGVGPKGGLNSDTSSTPGYANVESDFGTVGGLQYQYLTPFLKNRLSVGVQGQSNKTGLIELGYEF